MRPRTPENHDIGLECAWPQVAAPRQARLAGHTVHGARLVIFVLWILAGLRYGEAVSERGQ